MATTSIPEPASLKSWDEAFQYPLPTVRKLSLRLRKDIDDHRSRLRSLVGTSYRDLLGTAERIIDMDRQIQVVESGLSDIGRRCNSNILERSDTNYTKLERAWSQQGGSEQKLRSTAQCKILAGALSVVSRLIRSGGSPLQAAKLMILTRLLYKSLSEADVVQSILERHRRAIASLRSKLLAYIDRKLGREETSTDDLTEALSAYALLASSTPKDVLKHLLAVRVAQLKLLASNSTADSILAALSLYTATFVSVQTVFPKRLAEALAALSRIALLADRHIKNVEALNLDIYGRWIADDIRTFTPWVQQNSLSAQDGRQAMAEYSADVRQILLQGLRQCLAGISSAGTVLDVRKEVMGASLNIGTRIRMHGFQEQFEEFRQVFLNRLEEIIQTSAVLKGFDPLHNISRTTSKSSVWDLAENNIDLSSGGIHFRKAVLRQRNGRGGGLDQVLAPFETWRTQIEALRANIVAMRAARWDEYVETDVDDGEEEDVAPYQEMLSKEDATRLEQQLHSSVQRALEGGLEHVAQAVRNTEQPQFYIRLLRELHQQLLQLADIIGSKDLQSLVRYDLSKALHKQLARSVSSHGVEALRTAYTKRHFVPMELWEGTPKMPVQPLPATFKFVMTVQQEMSQIGEDVWSAAAVVVLKEAVQERLQEVLTSDIVVPAKVNGDGAHDQASEAPDRPDGASATGEATGTQTDDETVQSQEPQTSATELQVTDEDNGEVPVRQDESVSIDFSLDNIQRLFDGLYLGKVFGTGTAQSKWGNAVDTLKQRAALDADDLQRLDKYAAEYWKKTYLLFGLLASSSRSYIR